MRMSNFVIPEAIIPALQAHTKEGAIREMVQGLHSAGCFRAVDLDDIVKSILRREQLGSTGIGRGIAIPHTKHASADRLLGTLALSPVGVPFESIDGEPVFVLVLLISPVDQPGNHLRALENVVRTMKDESFVRSLRAATTSEEIWQLLDKAQPPWDR
jgi:PTS system nitrogen regulatory IIA component